MKLPVEGIAPGSLNSHFKSPLQLSQNYCFALKSIEIHSHFFITQKLIGGVILQKINILSLT